jgi:hypothetical protein
VLTLIIVVLALLVVAGLGLALLDRICAALAEHKASEYLAEPFGHQPLVRVFGTPFLTQAVRGCYREVMVSGGGLRIGDMTGATLNARIRNAYLPLGELLGRRARELPCEHVEGEIVIPYGELARVSRIPYLTLRYEDGSLVAGAALPVPGISALAKVSGEALLSIVGNGAVWLRLGGVSVAGITLPRVVLDQLLGTLSVPIPMPELPYGLRLTELKATPTGLMVCGSADATTFRRPTYLTSRDGHPAT